MVRRRGLFRGQEPKSEDFPTIRLVDRLLADAIEQAASDVHVEPTGDGAATPGRVRFRVDGAFREAARLEPGELPRVLARLKVLAGLSAFRTEEPQDGRLRAEAPDGTSCDVRLSTLPVVGGEKAVLRFLATDDLRGTADLGMADESRAALEALLDGPPGALVVTGPCSSGKSTTLHALVAELIAREGAFASVATVEDPVERVVEGASQTEVRPERGLDFPRALRAILRQDPEVILVGETRDPETARLAIEAAFTGHRVLTSLHVGRIEEVPHRLELLGVAPRLVDAALRGVVNQRLLRRRCTPCDGTGCDACASTGHRGRFAVAEIAGRRDGELVRLTPSLDELARRAVAEGRTSDEERARVLRAEDLPARDPRAERSPAEKRA